MSLMTQRSRNSKRFSMYTYIKPKPREWLKSVSFRLNSIQVEQLGVLGFCFVKVTTLTLRIRAANWCDRRFETGRTNILLRLAEIIGNGRDACRVVSCRVVDDSPSSFFFYTGSFVAAVDENDDAAAAPAAIDRSRIQEYSKRASKCIPFRSRIQNSGERFDTVIWKYGHDTW